MSGTTCSMDGFRQHRSNHVRLTSHCQGCECDFVEISDFDGDASRVQNFTMVIKTSKMDSTDIELFKKPKIVENIKFGESYSIRKLVIFMKNPGFPRFSSGFFTIPRRKLSPTLKISSKVEKVFHFSFSGY